MKLLSHIKETALKLHNFRSLRKLKSSMTIYLMLVLVVIMALICTLIESGRISAVNARLRSIAYMSADSVFAEFAQPLFDRYGVMMLWMDEKELTEKYNGYITENLNLTGTKAGMDLDLYGMRFQGSELKEARWITDQNGKAFSDQVYDYMKIHAAEGIAENLLSRSDFFEQGESVRKVIETLDKYQDEFAGVEETVSDIYEKSQRVKDLSENPKTLLEEIERTLTDYENGGADDAESEIAEKKQRLWNSKKELTEELSGIREKGGEYYSNMNSAQDAVSQMKEEFRLSEGEMDPEVYQALSEKLTDLETGGGGGQGVAQTIQAAEEYSEIINGLDTYLYGTGEALTPENAGAYRELTAQYKEQLEAFDLNRLETAQELNGQDRINGGFIRRIRKKYNSGLLELFAGEVSEKAVNQENLPSVTCRIDSSTTEEEGFVDKTVQKALFCEYIREHFSCFTSEKKDSVLDYEAEYILGGKDNDRDNLSSVVGKLVLLRGGANLISILLDSRKQAEIRELALAVVGFSGQLYLVKIAETIIMLVWSMAESMIDVQQLLRGKRVPAFKQSDDWFFSIEGLRNFTGEEDGGEGLDQGLSYEEYLLVLLMMENKNRQVFRTMDVIQANMCDEETENFRIKDCLTGAVMDASFTAASVFVSLPIVRRSFAAGGGGYGFRFTQEYSY